MISFFSFFNQNTLPSQELTVLMLLVDITLVFQSRSFKFKTDMPGWEMLSRDYFLDIFIHRVYIV